MSRGILPHDSIQRGKQHHRPAKFMFVGRTTHTSVTCLRLRQLMWERFISLYPQKAATNMIVIPITLEIDWLKSDLVRSKGVHASDIYGDLYRKLEPRRYDYEDDGNPLLMALGTAWERHFEYLLRVNGIEVERPDEFLSPEGIAYSPDLIIFNGITRLGEIKYTSMSADEMPETETNSLPPKLDKYLTQMMLYAFWLGLNDGWLAILFNHQPWNPQFRMFDLHWTDSELRDGHQMCMNHWQAMKGEK